MMSMLNESGSISHIMHWLLSKAAHQTHCIGLCGRCNRLCIAMKLLFIVDLCDKYHIAIDANTIHFKWKRSLRMISILSAIVQSTGNSFHLICTSTSNSPNQTVNLSQAIVDWQLSSERLFDNQSVFGLKEVAKPKPLMCIDIECVYHHRNPYHNHCSLLMTWIARSSVRCGYMNSPNSKIIWPFPIRVA